MHDILVHACCAPCACHMVTKVLPEQQYSPVLHWSNPNIHPWTEYDKRLGAVKELARMIKAELHIDDQYDLNRFLTMAMSDGDRCSGCYSMRLQQTAALARKLGIGRFTTSLLQSPRQKHDLIKQAADIAASDHKVDFIYMDLRSQYQQAVFTSKSMKLYRQKYCGCIFSEYERFGQQRRD